MSKAIAKFAYFLSDKQCKVKKFLNWVIFHELKLNSWKDQYWIFQIQHPLDSLTNITTAIIYIRSLNWTLNFTGSLMSQLHLQIQHSMLFCILCSVFESSVWVVTIFSFKPEPSIFNAKSTTCMLIAHRITARKHTS